MTRFITKRLMLLLLSGSFLFLTGCAEMSGMFGDNGGVSTNVTTGGPSVSEVTTYQGPKARIAVAGFDMKAAKGYGDIGTGMSDMLVDSLFKTNRFIVLERGEGLTGIEKELSLTESGYTEKGKAAKKGSMEGADILITGAITAFEPNAEGAAGGGGGIILPLPIIGAVAVKRNQAYIAATIRLVDVRTGRVINACRVEGKASQFKIGGFGGVGLGSVILAGALSQYKNTPMEKAVMVMLDNGISEIVKSVPDDYYRYSPGKH
jgi:curli biogenesis system outer membrane secretion channel CsgG